MPAATVHDWLDDVFAAQRRRLRGTIYPQLDTKVRHQTVLKAYEQHFDDMERFVRFYHDVHKTHSDGPDKKIVYAGATRRLPEKLRAAPHDKGEDYKGTIYFIGTNQTKTAEQQITAYLEKNKVKLASSGMSGIENGEKGYVFLVVMACEAWNAVAQCTSNDKMKVVGH